MIFALHFLLIFIPHQNLLAQNGFTWSNWVGCVVSENDRKDYSELIESGQCHRACQQSEVTYTMTGVPISQITNTIWHVVGGTIVSTPNNLSCVVKWGDTTTGAIGLTTTRIATNTTVVLPDICVKLTINPQAAFTIAPVDPSTRPPDTYNACSGQELFFENLSSANGGTPISGYYWDFGDGTSSSMQNPSHIYNQEGLYKVTLKVDNQCNCSSTISYNIIVRKKGVQIDCPSMVCEGQKATYSLAGNFAESCTQFNWSVIGGKIFGNPPYSKDIVVLWGEQPETDGFGYVTFDPMGCNVGCYVATTLKIPIIKQSATIKGDTSLCGPTQVRYTLPQWPTTDFKWEVVNSGGATATLTLTDQRNEVLLNTGSGKGIVVLKCNYTNTLLNCGGIARPLTITIKQPATISGASQTCVGTTETYTESSGQTVTWTLKKMPNGTSTTFNGNEYSPTFTSPVDYSISASGPYICNPISKLILVTQNETPVIANFTGSLSVCPGSLKIYTYNNTAPGTRIVWQTLNAGQIIETLYGNSVGIQFGLPLVGGPNYSIRLWRENISGVPCQSGTLIIPLSLFEPLIAIKGETIISPPNNIPCGSSYATYQVATIDMDSYEWELLPANAGNINVDASQPWKISVLWNQYINYAATLRLKTKKCIQEYVRSIPITISSTSIAIATATPSVCRGNSITFTLNNVSNPLIPITGSVVWDFGNGQTQTTSTPTVSYQYTSLVTASSNYIVKATITNPNGCTSTVNIAPISIQVRVAPVALITPANNVVVMAPTLITSLPVTTRTLTATISAGYGSVNAIKWFKNNIEILGLPLLQPTYVVTAFGNYQAVVYNNYPTGCSDRTNAVRFDQITPSIVQACPSTFNPSLSVINNCGSIKGTAINIGNPESYEWLSAAEPSATIPQTNTNAIFNYKLAGQYTIAYKATYLNNGVRCNVTRTKDFIVPYMADLKYTVTCGTGINYTVKLINNSNYYPSTMPNVITYKIKNTVTNAITILTPTQVADGIPLPAGNYIATIELSKTTATSYPMCSKDIPFVLEPKPSVTNVAFKMNGSTQTIVYTCPGTTIFLTLTTPVNPNWTYLWSFDKNNNIATNTQPNPIFSSPTEGSWLISLTVTNQYGCAFTTSPKTVNIIIAKPLVAYGTTIKNCQGTPASILFQTPQGSLVPVAYLWMQGNAPAPGVNNTSLYTTNTAGSYWLQTANASGCLRQVGGYSVTVSFIEIPNPDITTVGEVCIGNGVPLNSYIGNNPNYEYIWNRDNVFLSNQPSYTDYPSSVGTYSYTLEVRAPKGDGTYCSRISIARSVNVIESPTITSLTYVNELNPITGTCNPFKVKLTATANNLGTFTWSNGMNGASINETAGGAYQVIFTTESGCSVFKQIYVPKDLSSYLWVVPKGCYTFCDKLKTQQVIGPATLEFPGWAWLQNSAITAAGTLTVLPKDIYTAGSYQLSLGNGACSFKSDPLRVTYQDCVNNVNCHWFSATTGVVTQYTTPYIYYMITLNIGNTSATSITATITTTNNVGFFIPTTITVPPGGGAYTIKLFPNTPLPTGYIDVLVTTSDVNGDLCQKITSATLPSSNGGGPSSKSQVQNATTGISLKVYPNPASEIVSIQYEYPASGKTTELQVYDTTARLIESYQPTNPKGTWELPIANWASGMYIVTMKQDGIVIGQQNLIKK